MYCREMDTSGSVYRKTYEFLKIIQFSRIEEGGVRLLQKHKPSTENSSHSGREFSRLNG